MADSIQFSLAYVGPGDQAWQPARGERGWTVRDGIERTGFLKRFPEIDLAVNKVGIFGKPAKLDQALEDGDRIEIYRPLIADPKTARKKRAARADSGKADKG